MHQNGFSLCGKCRIIDHGGELIPKLGA